MSWLLYKTLEEVKDQDWYKSAACILSVLGHARQDLGVFDVLEFDLGNCGEE